jgi:hypothetical protein
MPFSEVPEMDPGVNPETGCRKSKQREHGDNGASITLIENILDSLTTNVSSTKEKRRKDNEKEDLVIRCHHRVVTDGKHECLGFCGKY